MARLSLGFGSKKRTKAQQEQLRRIQPLGTLTAATRVTTDPPALHSHLTPHPTDDHMQPEHIAHFGGLSFRREGPHGVRSKRR